MNHSEIANLLEGRFDTDLCTIHHFSDGLYAKQMNLQKNLFAVQHKHNYSHLSILAQGKVIVRTDESENIYSAPACIEIKSDMYHSVEALEDSVWFCIHATDEKNPLKVDEVIVKRG